MRTIRTQENRVKFLDILRSTANVSTACGAINIGRASAYEWRQDDRDFASAWDTAIEFGLDQLEQEARRRAFEGIEEPVFYKGEICGYIRRYSDTLIMFLLKAYRHQFRDRVQVDVNAVDSEIEQRLALMAAGGQASLPGEVEDEAVN